MPRVSKSARGGTPISASQEGASETVAADDETSALQSFGFQEGANDCGHVAVLAVHGIDQVAHIVVGNFPGKLTESIANLRMLGEHVFANDGNRLVGRKVMAVVFKDEEVKRGDQAVGGVARDEVNLVIF